VDGSCGMFESSVRSSYEAHIKAGEFKIITQFGRTKVPYFGDATRVYELLKNEDDGKIADVIFRQTELARPLAAPPGTPKDRVAALRKAMLATFKDAEMIADAKKVQGDFDPVPADEVVQMFAGFYNTPATLVKRARAVTQPETTK
jgi:tripartite-type tricarboxylate transporter receptor subunit TctC